MEGSSNQWLAGGVVTVVVFLAGLFLKEQTDISAINQRESDHAQSIGEQIVLIRSEIRDISDERARADDAIGKRLDTLGDTLSQRIDIVNQRLNEIQRQTSAIEGRLGDALPNIAPLRH